MEALTALVVGGRPAALPEDLDARAVPRLGALTEAAREAASPLIWVVDSAVTPGPAALPELLAEPGPPAVSLPVDSAGRPAEAWIGTFEDGDVAAVVAAARQRRAPLRFAPVLSMVVRREHVLAQPGPDEGRFGPYAGIEWTARLFSRERAMLVPSSRVEVSARPYPFAPGALLRAVESGALRRTDAFRQVRLARDARRSA